MPDLTHQRGALAVVVGDEQHRGRLEAEALEGVFLDLDAAEYLDRLRRGETGAATAWLGELRRGSGVDPWRLIEAVAKRALTVCEAVVESGPGQDPAAAEVAQAAASAVVTERQEA